MRNFAPGERVSLDDYPADRMGVERRAAGTIIKQDESHADYWWVQWPGLTSPYRVHEGQLRRVP